MAYSDRNALQVPLELDVESSRRRPSMCECINFVHNQYRALHCLLASDELTTADVASV
jgi:hypothetical protein